MQIKNIIFDLGGVLLNIDYLRTEKAFIELGCKDFHSIYSQAKQTEIFNDFEKGKISEKNFFEALRVLGKLDHVPLEKIEHAWNAMLISFPEESYLLLEKLKKKYKTFLLSNNNVTHIRTYEKMIEKVCPVAAFENLFDKFYYSCRMGMKKPDAECFEKILSENNLIASETLFIDDSIQHVEGALRVGMHARWLEKPMTTETLLRELNLI